MTDVTEEMTKTVDGSLKALIEFNKFTDCDFLVGYEETKFSAHKCVLAIRSPVFEAMFYGLNEQEYPIKLKTIDPKTFETLLRYIYTNDPVINSVDEALTVYLEANCYMLTDLKKKCSDFLINKLDFNNVCNIFEFSILISDFELANKSRMFITNNTQSVLSSEGFFNCEKSTVEMIVKQESLAIDESQLILGVYRWMEHYVEKEGKSLDELYPELENILRQLRYLSLTVGKFAEIAVRSKVLTIEQQRDIFIHLANTGQISSLPDIKSISNFKNTRGCPSMYSVTKGSVIEAFLQY